MPISRGGEASRSKTNEPGQSTARFELAAKVHRPVSTQARHPRCARRHLAKLGLATFASDVAPLIVQDFKA